MNQDSANRTSSNDVHLSQLSTDPASITKTLQTAAPALSNADRAELPACPPPLAWVDVLHEFRQSAELVTLNGTIESGSKVSARVWGTGSPLYILNGICGDSDLFCLLGWLIRDDFRCVIIDYPEAGSAVHSYASGLFAIADQLGDTTFDLLATSFGSAVGAKAALEQPYRIKRLVMQGPLGDFKLSPSERLAAHLLRLSPFRLKHLPFRKQIHAATHRLWFPPLDETRWQFLADNSGQTKAAQVARRALWLNRTKLDFAELRMPVLLISGEGEAPRYVAAAEHLAQRIPDARHEQLSNSGHVPFITHPHRLANLITPFLTES